MNEAGKNILVINLCLLMAIFIFLCGACMVLDS